MILKHFAVIRATDGAVVNAGTVPASGFAIQADSFGPGHFVIEAPLRIRYLNEWVYRTEAGVGSLVERPDSELVD